MATANDVLEFWFGSSTGEDPSPEQRKLWWKKDASLDAKIRERFGSLHANASVGNLDDWIEEPRSAVALVIILDQFSRNLYRQDSAAWAHDDKAQAIVRDALSRGHHEHLAPFEHLFLLMPLMHAEDAEAQAECVRRLEDLAKSAPESARPTLKSNVEYGYAHKKIVDRFGRFPHRNEVLGRESTPEEREFLAEPGSGF